MKLVIQSGSRVWGGVEKWMGMVAVGLRARGHEVIVSCHARGPVRERLESLGVPTVAVRPRGGLDLLSAASFALWLRRERPDALLLTVWRRLFWGAWAGRSAGLGRVVVRLGLFDPPRPRDPNRLVFRRWVDGVIANSADIRSDLFAAFPWFPPERVHVVFNGVLPPAPQDPAERVRLRGEMGAEGDLPLFVAAGHAFPRKGFDLLLRAFAAGGGGARLAIVGDGAQLPELRALAAELGIAPRVRFLGARGDAAALIAAADVFVLSSRHEGMANVMLEAMAAGTPVIATDVSGVREAIGGREGRPFAGWIVPSGDSAAMGAAIAEVCAALRTRPEAVAARVEEATWRVRRWFGLERMLDEVEAALFGGRG
jgi:glycosyltransferase involved in cell wall biosynthesis